MRKTLLWIMVCLLICVAAYRWGGAGVSDAKIMAIEQVYTGITRLFFPQIYLYDMSKDALVYRDMEKVMFPVVSRYRGDVGYQEMGQDEWQEEVVPFEQTPEVDEVPKESYVLETSTESAKDVSKREKQVIINRTKLQDFDYLRQNFYQIDNTTTIDAKLLDVNKLLGMDLTLKKNVKGPQVLIYHTHSQEAYADSKEGDPYTSVVALGNYLGRLLSEKYGIEVIHHVGEYDVLDRDSAYSTALPYLQKVLKEYPSIEVVIDLHRDGVPQTTRLVTEVDGKPTAQIMFFNGLSRTTSQGELKYLANPYIEENLAFSLQMQLAAAEYYPGLTRRIYLKGYRYNMHLAPKSLLVEVGAQTNTFEEAKNAMEPLAELLEIVLNGT